MLGAERKWVYEIDPWSVLWGSLFPYSRYALFEDIYNNWVCLLLGAELRRSNLKWLNFYETIIKRSFYSGVLILQFTTQIKYFTGNIISFSNFFDCCKQSLTRLYHPSIHTSLVFFWSFHRSGNGIINQLANCSFHLWTCFPNSFGTNLKPEVNFIKAKSWVWPFDALRQTYEKLF